MESDPAVPQESEAATGGVEGEAGLAGRVADDGAVQDEALGGVGKHQKQHHRDPGRHWDERDWTG